MPRSNMPRSTYRALLAAVATVALVAPVISTAAEARGNKSGKKSGEMMRLGGPTNGNGRIMRLGGPAPLSTGGDIYALPGRLVGNNPADLRLFFLRNAEAGSGGGR